MNKYKMIIESLENYYCITNNDIYIIKNKKDTNKTKVLTFYEFVKELKPKEFLN